MFKKKYYKILGLLEGKSFGPIFLKLVKYIFSGFAGMATNIVILYLMTSKLGVWYLLSSIVSFSTSVFVSFVLHKNLTFNDLTRDKTDKKFLMFVAVAVTNLVVNTSLLYFLTDLVGLYYILSQIISSVLIATWSYFLYHWLVFDVDGV